MFIKLTDFRIGQEVWHPISGNTGIVTGFDSPGINVRWPNGVHQRCPLYLLREGAEKHKADHVEV